MKSLLYIFILLFLIGCNRKPYFDFIENNNNDSITFQVDSLSDFISSPYFAIRFKFINNSNQYVLLLLDNIQRKGYTYKEIKNFYFISNKKKIILGSNDDYFIFKPKKTTYITFIGFLRNINDSKKAEFNQIENFKNGKIVYVSNEDILNKLNNKDVINLSEISKNYILPKKIEKKIDTVIILEKFEWYFSISN